MKAYYEKELRIGASMCGADGRLGIHNTFALFQDIASEHAEALGVGFQAMTARRSFWLTARSRVRFCHRPAIMTGTSIETWPAAPGSVRCDRFYRLRAGETLLAEGRTEWCVYDTEKNAVNPVSEAGFIDGLEYREEKLLDAPWARLRHNFSDEDQVYSHTVATTDVDLGRHMNNVAYLRVLTDSFSVAELENMRVSEMEILFLMPCFEGDALRIMRRATDYGYEFGVRRPDGRYAALAQLRAEAK